MFERLYTTKMSADKKTLQKRFSKIRSKSGRISKMMSFAMSILVAVTMLCATVVLASVVNEAPEQFKIDVKHGNTVIQLDNKPYVYDNTVYLPLRELMEKIGLLDHENSYINWDNGKIEMELIEKTPDAQTDKQIEYLAYNYGIEIGKAEYTLNPSMAAMYQQKWNISNRKQMSYAPMLKDGVTYIPFEFVEYLINRSMQTTKITLAGDAINSEYYSKNSSGNFELSIKTSKQKSKTLILRSDELNKFTSFGDRSNLNLYYYGLSEVNLLIDNHTISLIEALEKGKLTLDDIIIKANRDVADGVIEEISYDDGGSSVFKYPDYTIIKYYTLDGNRDVYIGSTDMDISIANK